MFCGKPYGFKWWTCDVQAVPGTTQNQKVRNIPTLPPVAVVD